MIRGKTPVITELNERSREIFRHIVEAYVATGEPIGSTLLRSPGSINPRQYARNGAARSAWRTVRPAILNLERKRSPKAGKV